MIFNKNKIKIKINLKFNHNSHCNNRIIIYKIKIFKLIKIKTF